MAELCATSVGVRRRSDWRRQGGSLAKGIRGGSLAGQVEQEDKDWGRAFRGDRTMNKDTEVGCACDQIKRSKT